ncbi:hypothetical protein EMCRGX_G020071 [Ephydatia muelleri]
MLHDNLVGDLRMSFRSLVNCLFQSCKSSVSIVLLRLLHLKITDQQRKDQMPIHVLTDQYRVQPVLYLMYLMPRFSGAAYWNVVVESGSTVHPLKIPLKGFCLIH